jgi:hypothetical protein
MKRQSKQVAAQVAVVRAGLWMGSGMAGAQEAGAEARASSELQRGAHQRIPLPRPVADPLDPALQGGADYTHNPSGFYAGTWLSTIKWTKDLGGDGNVESTCTAASAANLTPEISYDVGGLYYWYPSNDLGPNANTFELYGQVGYGPATSSTRTRRPTCSAPPTANRAATSTWAPTCRP